MRIRPFLTRPFLLRPFAVVALAASVITSVVASAALSGTRDCPGSLRFASAPARLPQCLGRAGASWGCPRCVPAVKPRRGRAGHAGAKVLRGVTALLFYPRGSGVKSG